jgi:hypothetical protein
MKRLGTETVPLVSSRTPLENATVAMCLRHIQADAVPAMPDGRFWAVASGGMVQLCMPARCWRCP